MSRLGASDANQEISLAGFWELKVPANGYAKDLGSDLVTQIFPGRCFEVVKGQLLEGQSQLTLLKRIKVRLVEDGYICWIDLKEIQDGYFRTEPFEPDLLDVFEIDERIPAVLEWIENAALNKNKYLWGGTLGPDFDCSGLVQTSFASQGIWLPRDAYQQESFCEKVLEPPFNNKFLRIGDLLFFGTKAYCNHVGVYKGNGFYWHSSGLDHGHNGIACEELSDSQCSPVASFYFSHLRGVGRVKRCHDGTTLP